MLQQWLKLTAFIRDKPGFVIAMVFMIAISWFAYGCEPKTKSLIDPSRDLTRAELQIEIDSLIALSKARFEDIQKKEEFRRWLFEQGTLAAQTGGVNPIGVITSLFGLFGVGATADNIRLRKQRKNASQG